MLFLIAGGHAFHYCHRAEFYIMPSAALVQAMHFVCWQMCLSCPTVYAELLCSCHDAVLHAVLLPCPGCNGMARWLMLTAAVVTCAGHAEQPGQAQRPRSARCSAMQDLLAPVGVHLSECILEGCVLAVCVVFSLLGWWAHIMAVSTPFLSCILWLKMC